MLRNDQAGIIERQVTPVESFLSRSPYALVAMVARIRGDVSREALDNAVSQVCRRHAALRVRVRQDGDGALWFTSEGAGEIPIQVVPRESDDDWIQVYHQACRVPFEFDVRPAIRFILVHSATLSELILFCHHMICDGMSLAYLARDVMVHLGDPACQAEPLPDPAPIDRDSMPQGLSLNPIVRFFVNRINKQWARDKVLFDQEDYKSIHEAYWTNFHHGLLSVELSEAQTTALVERCRKENVTVNTALTTAFAGAQSVVQGDKPDHAGIGIAANLRDRLQKPVGESMGFYAGMVTLGCKYDRRASFWDNARRFHDKIRPLFTDARLFQEPLLWSYLDPAMVESFHFKRLGALVAPQSARYGKLSAFSRLDDVVSSLLKRNKMDALDKMFLGTAVTNLARLEFPVQYGALELDRLILQPGGGFPLSTVNLVLGAVTCAGKLSLVVEYAEETLNTDAAEAIRTQAMAFLLGE